MDPEIKKQLTEIIERVKLEVSCCCSWHRYNEITKLCEEMEKLLEQDSK